MRKETVYGVQFRDMHTAIHNVAIFESREIACCVLRYIQSHEQWPDFDIVGHMDTVEINYRHVPEKYGDVILDIVNNDCDTPNGVPDCYC